MSNRWNEKEILKMIKLYSKGKTEKEIGKKLNRSESAIRLRLENTVYDNIVDGKSVDQIAKLFKTDVDTIIMMYYSHKSFKLSRDEEVVDIDVSELLSSNSSKNGKSSKSVKSSKSSKSSKSTKSKTKSKGKTSSEELDLLSNDIDIDEDELDRLKLENEIMGTIVKNRDLKESIKKLIKSGKLSKLEKNVLKVLIK